MGSTAGKPAVAGALMLVMMCLSACGHASDPGSAAAAARPAAAPRFVTPRSVVGSPGKGPLVISSPVPLPGGTSSSQRVVLHDRTLVIKSVTATRQRGLSTGSVVIAVNLTIRGTSDKAIRNESTFFTAIGSEGDTFGPQDNSSGDFYRTIDARGSRSGTIDFEVPAAAASDLYLLYRPEVTAETMLTRLKAG